MHGCEGGVALLKRIVAVASSMLMAAGTTPIAFAETATRNDVFVFQPQPSMKRTSLRLVGPVNSSASDGVNTTLDLRTQLREYHYAVSNHKVVPIWQDPTERRELLYQQRADHQNTDEVTATVPKTAKSKATSKATSQTKSGTKSNDAVDQQVADLKEKAQSALSGRAGGPTRLQDISSGLGRFASRLALHLVGTAYRFGGDTTRGFDCSGLVQYVYQKAGIALPRTSYEQFRVGSPVSLKDLRPGDLLFFSTYGRGASHVAIYVGNGHIVQALNSNTGVVISSLSDSYYRTHYIGARRP